MTSRLYTGLCFIVLLVMALKTMAASLSPLVLTDSMGNQPVVPPLEMLEDPSGKLALKDVLSARYADKFVAAKTARPDIGYTGSAWWVRVKLNIQSQEIWYLLVDQAIAGDIELFIPPSAPSSYLPKRLEAHRTPAWKLKLPLGETVYIYLRANNGQELLHLPIKLMQVERFIGYSNHQSMFFMMVFSGLLVLAVYNSFLFYYLREHSYLCLSIVIAALQLIFLHDSNLFPALSFLNNPYSRFYPLPFFILIASAAHYWRIVNQDGNRCLELLLKWLQWVALTLFPIVSLLTDNIQWIYRVISLLLPIILMLIIQAAWMQHRLTQERLLPVLIFSLVMFLYTASRSGYCPQYIESSVYGFQAGSVITFMLLSINQINYSRQLQEQAGQANAASRAKEAFLTTMSHELRTPMNAVIGISGLMRRTALNAEQKNYLNKLEVSSRHLLRLIDNILDFSKIEQAEFKIAQKPFKLDDVLNDVKNILYAQANHKGLQLVCHHRYFGNESIVGDDTRLAQVLLNLAGNALKFTEQGRVDVFIREVKSSTDKSLTFYFEIRDTGIGISAAQLQQLFRPFSQADSGTKKRYGGSGLGLVISQRLVRVMGGELQVETALNEGSRFFFTLNFARWVNSDEQLSMQPILAQIRPIIPNTHILLVDDDDINRFVARRFLEARHIGVTLAANGQEALAVLDNPKLPPFAMVFMDVSMPEMDGYEATRKIRAMGYTHLPIIALTAHAITGERERCVAAGMNDFFTKPFELHELEQIVRKWA